ncbi:hypothetical protein OIO90_002946 [Microbotryomycetes sp. JL221]|nr:hypothetical protein OIO90_002946 [Microbotryomycetes sp. JL221]
MGRRKISIAPIADDRNRSVTFLKRKNGLFKKAYELGVLCSADVAVIVFNNAGKLFEFHSGDMDQILLRYSHYSGPAYEKRGPEDYAQKSLEDAAKAGAGGRAGAAAAGAGDDDDDDEIGSDDSEGAKPLSKAKKGAARGRSGSGANAAAQNAEAAKQPAPPYSQDPYGHPAGIPQYTAYSHHQQQPQGAWPGHAPANGYSMPPASTGAPQRAATMPMLNPWMPAGAQSGNLGQWAMQSLYSAAAAAAANGAPPSNSNGQNGVPSYQLPPLSGMPDFGMLHQAYQQSQQPPLPSTSSFFPGMPGMSQSVPMFFPGQPQHQSSHVQQQQQQQHQHQHQHQGMQQHQGQLTSSPQSSSQRAGSTPRDESDRSAAATPSTGSGGQQRGPPSRSNSMSNKPKLSVNIPGEGGGNETGAPTVQVTGERNGRMDQDDNEDDGSRTAHPTHQQQPRYATDLLPSPSGFLSDVIYASGPPYSSLSGLNTAIAMSNGEDGRPVFQWPVMQQQQQQQQGQGNSGSNVTSVPHSDVREDRQHESAERSSAKRGSIVDDMSIDGRASDVESNTSKRSRQT